MFNFLFPWKMFPLLMISLCQVLTNFLLFGICFKYFGTVKQYILESLGLQCSLLLLLNCFKIYSQMSVGPLQ